MVQIAWLILGGTAFVACVFAWRDRRALFVARAALGVLYLGAGALVHAMNLLRGVSYADFANAAHFAFVRDAWAAVVVPETGLFIGLLTIFEATVGVLILTGDRWTRVGLWGALLMHVGLLVFGWVITVWSVLMLVTFTLLLRAEQNPRPTRPQRTGRRTDTCRIGRDAASPATPWPAPAWGSSPAPGPQRAWQP